MGVFVATVREGLLAKIREAGFEIAMQKEVTITKQQAEDFYKEHRYVRSCSRTCTNVLVGEASLRMLLYSYLFKRTCTRGVFTYAPVPILVPFTYALAPEAGPPPRPLGVFSMRVRRK